MTKNYPWLRILLVIMAALLMIKVINQTDMFLQGLALVKHVLVPVFWGGVLAFLLDPSVRTFQKKFRLPRYLSVALTGVLFILLIVVCVLFLLPLLINGVRDIMIQIPIWLNQADQWAQGFESTNFLVNQLELGEIIKENAANFNRYAQETLTVLLHSSLAVIMSTTSFFISVFFTCVATIFLLLGKEGTLNGMITVIHALFKSHVAALILHYAKISKDIFYQFVVGKIIESTILSLVAILGFTLIGMPYALLLSVVIGVTNVIPYIGPFFGGIPPVLIGLFISPWQMLAALAVVAVVQLVDNAILQPKILGEIVGLPPIWVLISVLTGGALFGPFGMLLGIPVCACIKVMFGDYLEYRLAKKGLTGNPPRPIIHPPPAQEEPPGQV